MDNKSFEVKVHLNKKIFSRFAWFDAFFRQGRIKLLVGFSAIMFIFALIALLFSPNETDSTPLVITLFAVGLLLPLAHLFQFFMSIQNQIKLQKLGKPKHVYTLKLSPGEIEVRNQDESASYPTEKLYNVYIDKDCAYIFIIKQRAFLLPYQDIENGKQAVVDYMTSNVDKNKIKYLNNKGRK